MNTLTGMIPSLYEGLNVVSREMVGFIPAVTIDASLARAAVGQEIRSPVATCGPLEDVVPGPLPADSGDTTVGYTTVTISKSKAAPIRWTGEEERGVSTGGTFNKILADQFAEALRLLVNAMEADLAAVAVANASAAYGTAGTVPFGTAADLTDFAGPLQLLEAHGARGDLQIVVGGPAMFNLRGKQSTLFKVNEAGSSDMLRNGMTDRALGFSLRNSAGLATHAKGTGTGYVTSGSTTVGATGVALVTGNGTVLPGDILTFAADTTNKYVANVGVAAPGTITLAAPGARVVIPTGNAMTIGASYSPNVAFARSALVFVSRAPAVPQGGDSASETMTIQDPITNLVFEISVYRQYKRVKYEVAAAWGQASAKNEHIVLLAG